MKLAQEHEKARELERIQRYHMPKDMGVSDYIEVDELEKMPLSEQKKWEKDQMSSAVFKFGAKDAVKKDEYELLLEDQIEFIQALKLPGKSPIIFPRTFSTICLLPKGQNRIKKSRSRRNIKKNV